MFNRKRLLKNKSAVSFVIKMATILFLTGCMDSKSDSLQPVTAFSPASCAQIAGLINTSAGGSNGAQYSILFSNGSINYSNINNTFYTSSNTKKIIDVGNVCLDSVSVWPGGGVGVGATISAIVGHAYIVEYNNPPTCEYPVGGGAAICTTPTTSYTKFIVNSYQNGIIRLSYVPYL